jgi:hypothetical protein
VSSPVLTSAAVLTCPHGGSVRALTSSPRVLAGGAGVLRTGDAFVVAGCAFTVGPAASPCTSVTWTGAAARVLAEGQPVLTAASVGLCSGPSGAPQGAVVVASPGQARVTAS